MIPADWKKFMLEWDAYRNHWIAYAIAPKAGEDWWFKATAATTSEAFSALLRAVAEGRTVGTPIRPSQYVKGAFREATLPPSRTSDIDPSTLTFNL